MDIKYKPSEEVLYRINEDVDINPLFDKRCNYGIRSLKKIPKGFAFRLRMQEASHTIVNENGTVFFTVINKRIVFVGDGVRDINEKIVDYKGDDRVEKINPLYTFFMENSSPATDVRAIFVKCKQTRLDIVEFAEELLKSRIITGEQLEEILLRF